MECNRSDLTAKLAINSSFSLSSSSSEVSCSILQSQHQHQEAQRINVFAIAVIVNPFVCEINRVLFFFNDKQSASSTVGISFA